LQLWLRKFCARCRLLWVHIGGVGIICTMRSVVQLQLVRAVGLSGLELDAR
jgi:hypothetical protein